MKTLIFILVLIFCLNSFANSTHAKKPSKKSALKLQTEVDFSDLLVNGKYQYADQAVASVEDEKGLNDLLGIRKHFKDRLSQSSVRH